MNDCARWNEHSAAGRGSKVPKAQLAKYVHWLRLGLALDPAAGVGQNAQLDKDHMIVLDDVSDAEFARASGLRPVAAIKPLCRLLSKHSTSPTTSNFDDLLCRALRSSQ